MPFEIILVKDIFFAANDINPSKHTSRLNRKIWFFYLNIGEIHAQFCALEECDLIACRQIPQVDLPIKTASGSLVLCLEVKW